MKPAASRSAKVGWFVAAVALVLLVAVLVLRSGTATWTLAGGGGLLVLALLLCPLVMGATMFFMMRGGH